MNDEPFPGPLEDFLNHPPQVAAAVSLRAELLRQTSRQVRRRHRLGRVAALTALAAALLLTAAGAWLAWHAGDEQPDPPRAHRPDDSPAMEARAKPGPEPMFAHEPKLPPAAEPQSAVALEWQAFDAPRAERAALYLQAGDRYLEDARDVASALRCYNVALEAAPMEVLDIQPDDNWLVTTLKLDHFERRKEK